MTANVIVGASGLLSRPKEPDIPGIQSFGGEVFHSALWNHDVQLSGKLIGLVGTGSSGTQMTAHLAEQARELVVYQRTASWIAPIENYRDSVSAATQWLFDHVPHYWNWYCYSLFVASNGLQGAEEYDPEWRSAGGLVNEQNDRMRAAITAYIESKLGSDRDLFAKCLPTHTPLSRRAVVDNGFYDALLRDNVELVVDKIARFTPRGLATADGVEREHDIVVLAAGFEVHRYFWPLALRGRGGMSLEELWKRDGARAYLGVAMPHFPNFFCFYGPNASPRAGGFYTWAELWSRYIAKVVIAMIENDLSSVEVRSDVFDEYNAELDRRMKSLIWHDAAEGSYYVNEHGRADVKMPWRVHEYYEWIVEPRLDDYVAR